MVKYRKVDNYMPRRVKNEEKLEQLASLWYAKSKKGSDYMTGVDEDKNRLVAFFNDNKKNPNEPDIRIYFQKEEK